MQTFAITAESTVDVSLTAEAAVAVETTGSFAMAITPRTVGARIKPEISAALRFVLPPGDWSITVTPAALPFTGTLRIG